MRCLYCGRELALLKRLTGNGEFCSDQHKQSYHDEYNRLALSRLLQAQTKTDEVRAKTGKPEPAGTPSLADAPSPQSKRERGPALPVPVAYKPEPVATGAAGFVPEPMTLLVGPAPETFSAAIPLSWVPGPVFPVFNQVQPLQIETPPEDPPLAGLLEFPAPEFPTKPTAETSLSPVQASQEGPFGDTPPFYPRREEPVKEDFFHLPMAGPVSVPGIAPVAPGMPELSQEDSQPFFPEVFQLMVPSPSQDSIQIGEAAELHVPDGVLALPAAEPVNQPQPQQPNTASLPDAEPETDAETDAETDIDSLRRLQNGLRPKAEPDPPRRSGRRTELPVVSGPVVDALALDSLLPPPPRQPAGLRVNAGSQGRVATLEKVDVDTEAVSGTPTVLAEATAPFMEQILPITLRIVSPAKARLVSESRPLVVPCNPQLTTTEILPMRPRIGIGKPPSTSQPDSPSKAAGATAANAAPNGAAPIDAVKVKPVKTGTQRPAAAGQPPRNEKPFDPRQAVLAVKRSVNVPETKSAPALAMAEKATPVEARNPEPEIEATLAAPLTSDPAPVAEPAKAPAPTKPVDAPQAKPEALRVPSSAPPNTAPDEIPSAKTATGKVSQTAQNGHTDFELHLGIPETQSVLARLPMAAKIGIAIALLLAIAAAGYMIFFRSGKSPSLMSVQAASAAGVTQAQSGWLADWAGDITGNHKGRKISIYRPSLNSTNYQIEFQGKIENNSLGWVFRASNASNFYVVKLAATGAGYRLLKYTVVDGKEKETGQVPVRPVNGNTFPIRFEVRGDRFTTFIGSNPVDTWVDGQLKKGGIGFLTDRADRAEITNVGISLLPGSAN